MMRQVFRARRAVPPLVVLLSAALAAGGTISNVIFRIDASNAQGAGYLEFYSNELVYNPGTNSWDWSKSLTEIQNSYGDTIAVLDSATLSIVRDPEPGKPYRINLGFALHAGETLTHFTLKSALLSFPAIPPELLQPPDGGGRATVSLSVTDENGNGAELLGYGGTGAGAYTAQYNGWVPTGTTFANLLNLVQAGPGGSGTGSQTYPGGAGYAGIPVAVYDMSAGLDFTLTAVDAGSGTTSYRVLPEPAASLGLLCAGLLGMRRRS